MLAGTGALVVGVAFTLLALAVRPTAVFFAGPALSGVGSASSLQRGIRTVVPGSPRMSGASAVLLFAVAYLGLGVPAVAADILVVHGPGLIGATEVLRRRTDSAGGPRRAGAPSRGTEGKRS
jgi:hypothetical protein